MRFFIVKLLSYGGVVLTPLYVTADRARSAWARTWVCAVDCAQTLVMMVEHDTRAAMDIVCDKRNEAALLFKKNDFNGALKLYCEASQFLDTLHQENVTDRAVLYSNAAQCQILLGRWNDAIVSASKALEIDPGNIKALYRRALAYEELERYVDALRDAKRAAERALSNKAVVNAVYRLRQKLLESEDAKRTEQLPATSIATLENDIRSFVQVPDEQLEHAILSSKPTKSTVRSIDDALRNLRAWTVAHKRRTLFLNGTSLRSLVAFLYAVTSSSSLLCTKSEPLHCCHVAEADTASPIPEKSWETPAPTLCLADALVLNMLAQVLRFLTTLLTDNEGIEHDCEACKAVYLDKPLTIDPEIQNIRDHFSALLSPCVIRRLIEGCIRHGVGQERFVDQGSAVVDVEQKKDEVSSLVSRLRTTCVLLTLELLEYNYNLDSTDCLEALSTAINTCESDLVTRRALRIAGRLADRRRRYGSRVAALKKTQPLMKLLENALETLSSSSNDVQRDAQFALTSLFTLLADKDRSAEDSVSIEDLGLVLLEPYLEKDSDGTGTLEQCCSGLKGLLLLCAADRQSVKTMMLSRQYLELHILRHLSNCSAKCPELQSVIADVLMCCMEFAELRAQFLELDGLDAMKTVLSNKKPKLEREALATIKLLVVLSRLCVHEESVRKRIVSEFDLMPLAISCISSSFFENSRSEQTEHAALTRFFLEVIFFLTLHASFKTELLPPKNGAATGSSNAENPLELFVSAGQHAIRQKDALSSYYFVNSVCNLMRNRDSKEHVRRPRAPGAPELDDDQVAALQEFFEKLPEHSRPFGRKAQYDRGGEHLVTEFREILIKCGVVSQLAQICLWTSPFPSLNLAAACSEAVALLSEKPERRGDIVKAGCIPALISACKLLIGDTTGTYKADVARCRQVLALLCIAVNPATLSYTETLSLVPQLLPLLSDAYELYQYEAALALTNLTSFSEDVRNCVYHNKGIALLMDVATSDNALCRAAGLEGVCNMALSPLYQDTLAQGGRQMDLQLLLAFLNETENERAQSAAAGCLAMLMVDVRVSVRVAQTKNAQNLVKALERVDDLTKKPGLKLRLLTIVLHLCELCHITQPIPISASNQEQPHSELEVTQDIRALQQQLINVLKTGWPKHLLVTPDANVRELYDKVLASAKELP